MLKKECFFLDPLLHTSFETPVEIFKMLNLTQLMSIIQITIYTPNKRVVIFFGEKIQNLEREK